MENIDATQVLALAENAHRLLQGASIKLGRKTNNFQTHNVEDQAKAVCGESGKKGALSESRAPVSSQNSLFGLQCSNLSKPKKRKAG